MSDCLPSRDATSTANVDVLLVDADVWFSKRALEQLLAAVASSGSAVRVTGRGPATDDGSTEPELLALYVPASTAPSFLRRIDSSALRHGLATISAQVIDAREIDVRELDPSLSFLRVATFLDAATLERHILIQRARDALRAGVRIRDPHNIAIRGELHCGVDVEIDLNVIIEGNVTLGDGVRVGAHVILINATIGSQSRIHPYSIVDNAQVGAGTMVGPYARVRPGSVIGERSQIGNFVEIKNSDVGSGSRINHFSFVGDATLGQNVTLGAGTITCNHNQLGTVRTRIGEGAYVGSGTELVAPVVIGENATIGAGSTITEDAPAGMLTLARAKQVTVPNWTAPTPKPPGK